MFKTIALSAFLIVLPQIAHAAVAVEDGTLIKGSGPRVYVVSNGERRWIQTERDFLRLGYRWDMLRRISDSELLQYPRGEAVNADGGFPDYTLIKGSGPRVYVVIGSMRRWVSRPSLITDSLLQQRNIITVSDQARDALTEGIPVTSPIPKGPETTVTIGPSHGSSTESTSFIFGFRGSDQRGSTNVTFETKIEGYDTAWVDNGTAVERRVTLPALPFPYVFFVRAKDSSGLIDRTPAYRQFSIGHSVVTGSVKIRGVNSGTEDPKTEYVTLEVIGESSVNFTGWTIGNERNARYTLDQVVEDYSLSNTFSQSLVVGPGGTVVINVGRSPVGKNFRLNSCIGYLERIAPFTPALNSQCPVPSDSILQSLTRACQSYLSTIPSCALPPEAPMATQNSVGRDCIQFGIDRYNYNRCREDHRFEPEFFQKEWRLFLGLTNGQFLDSDHDEIVLRDSSGKIVDRYSY